MFFFFIFQKKTMNELKHLALTASIREVFSGTDSDVKTAILSEIGGDVIEQLLISMLQGDQRDKILTLLGTHMTEYQRYDLFARHLSTSVMRELEEALEREAWGRKRFCLFRTCKTKREAKKHPRCYEVKGEYGGEYGYFEPVTWNEEKKSYVPKPTLTEEEESWLEEYPECCYQSGQPCERWQQECADEDCECILAREYCSLVLSPID